MEKHMPYGPDVFFQAGLFVAGLWWCAHVLRRWMPDLEEFRTTPDPAARLSLGLVWGATGVIAVLLVRAVVLLAARFG
jgi:hypothetical protein